MKLWCLSVSQNDQNQQSVRSRECTQVNQSEGGSHTFCFISLPMRLSWALTSIPATLRHLGHQQPISTAQHWNQPVRKVSVSEKKMLSDNACIAQKALWMPLFRRTTLAFVSATCTARNFSRNLSKSSRSMDRRFVDHGERACSTSGQSQCGPVSIWSVLTSKQWLSWWTVIASPSGCYLSGWRRAGSLTLIWLSAQARMSPPVRILTADQCSQTPVFLRLVVGSPIALLLLSRFWAAIIPRPARGWTAHECGAADVVAMSWLVLDCSAQSP